jgi:hypothetical protein
LSGVADLGRRLRHHATTSDGCVIAWIRRQQHQTRDQRTWKSSGSNQIQFGPLGLTRAKCPPGSLHDQIVKKWGNVCSFVVKDGHLFLSLTADGGIYESEPVTKKP